MPNSPELTLQINNTNKLAKTTLHQGVIRCYMELWAPLIQQQGYVLRPGWEKRQDLGIQAWCHVVLQRIDDPQFCFSVDFNLIYGDRMNCNCGVFGKPYGGDCRVKGELADFFAAIEVRYQRWIKAGRIINVNYD